LRVQEQQFGLEQRSNQTQISSEAQMPNSPIPLPVFDGHNDLVLRLIRGQVTAEDVTAGLSDGHIDKPRAIKGGFGGGMFAIFVPSPGDKVERHEEMRKPSYDVELPEPLAEDFALDWTERGFAALDALEQAGAICLCRSVSEIETALPSDKIAAVTHIEGAEAIDRDFERLHEFHTRGLKSLGPVWSRDTVWGHGVPFRYPSDPDIGPGLTEAGIALIQECNRLKILVDLSHLNEKGFNDVARITDAPLVATHSNAWSVTPHSRNLTDRQLDMIRDSDGMVGINFASAFLRPDGQMDDNFNLDIVLRHFDHLVKRLGENCVGLGTDFDGALVPKPIKDCAGLPKLLNALALHGVDTDLMAKIAHGNWLRVLRLTWN
jgi:membrane dipeptidase